MLRYVAPVSNRAKALLALAVIAAGLIGVTVWSALRQYKTYDDPRPLEGQMYITFGVGVEDRWARVYEPDIHLRFFREDDAFFLDAELAVNSGENSKRAGPTTCYYFVPPNTQLAEFVDEDEDGIPVRQEVGDLALFQKFEDYWAYSQSCEAPEPTEFGSVRSNYYSARFELSPNNWYRSRYREYQLEFDVAGLDGKSGLMQLGIDAERSALIKRVGVDFPSTVRLEVDSDGWNLTSHLPSGLDVQRETSSSVLALGGADHASEDAYGGTPTFTISKPTGELSLGLVQLFATLFLGVVIDQMIQLLGKRDASPQQRSARPPIPPKRTSPTKNKKKRK